jgi:two-component system sensor histidine kinase PhoQ
MDSLRARLVVGMILVLALFLALTGLALDRAHTRSVEAGVREGLETRIYLLLGAAEFDDGALVMPDALAEPRLGTPDSGLYAAVRGPDGEILWRSRSSLGRNHVYPPTGRPGEPVFRQVRATRGETLYSLAYPVSWERDDGNVQRLDFVVAESTAASESRIAAFRRTLALWLGALTLALLAVQAMVLTWGLRPLQRAAREVAGIEAGERERLGDAYPRELRPLTRNLNAMLVGSRARLERYRNALSDLGHSLKTPLAVLRSLSDQPTVREQADRMERAINWHVQRAAAAGRTGLSRAVPVADVVDRVVAALEKVYGDKAVVLEREIAPDARFHGDPEDLMELVGNLLDNAWKWCRRRVRIRAESGTDGILVLAVEDDGPGIPESRRREVLVRGARGDEAVPGEGIGLYLVRQMVEEVYEGRLELSASRDGGLRVQATLPAPAS